MFLIATISQGRKQGADSILARAPSRPTWSRGLAQAPALSSAAQCHAVQVPGPQAKGKAHSRLRTDALLTLRKALSPLDHWAPDLFSVTCVCHQEVGHCWVWWKVHLCFALKPEAQIWDCG